MEIIGEFTRVVKVPGADQDGKPKGIHYGPGEVAFDLKDGRGVKEMVEKWVADGIYIPSGAKKVDPKPAAPKA